MRTIRRATDARAAAAIAAMAILAGAAAGCGGQDADADVRTAQPQVDPRYATADAFLDYFNELNTATPPRFAEIRRYFRTETPEQQRLLDSYDFLLSIFELELAADQHIDDYTTSMPIDDILAPSGPARITERLDRRVIATYLDSTGAEEALHMVKLDDRWWISGYTLEYSREFTETARDIIEVYEQMGVAEHQRDQITRLNQRLTERVRRGEFNTQREFYSAMITEVTRLFEP